jgi:hypothetical protein
LGVKVAQGESVHLAWQRPWAPSPACKKEGGGRRGDEFVENKNNHMDLMQMQLHLFLLFFNENHHEDWQSGSSGKHLPSKCKTLSSNPNITKKNKEGQAPLGAGK